jgi:hypothetical protein
MTLAIVKARAILAVTVLVVAALLAPSSASGAIHTRSFSGTLSCFLNCSSPDATQNTFLNSKKFTGFYSFDDTVVPTSGNPNNFRDYGSGVNVFLNIDNGLYTATVTNAGVEILRNQSFNGEDRVFLIGIPSVVFGGTGIGTFPAVAPMTGSFQSFIIYEHLGAGNVLPNTLITSWPVATGWTFAGVEFYISDTGGGNIVGFRGAFTAISPANNKHDFNGDAKADVLWRDTSGNVALWVMNGLSAPTTSIVGNVAANWSIVGIGDFNSDGKADVLWRDTSGNVSIWLMSGATVTTSAILGNVPTVWTVEGVRDFNGDGKADILWRNTSSGAVSVWLMNGTTVATSGVLPAVPLSWSIDQVGDFNGDGKADILWRNTSSGAVSIWLMNGTVIASSGVLPAVALSWTIEKVGDFNGDLKADIFWRNTSGDTAIWQMNGLAVSTSGGLGNVGNTWSTQVVGAP